MPATKFSFRRCSNPLEELLCRSSGALWLWLESRLGLCGTPETAINCPQVVLPAEYWSHCADHPTQETTFLTMVKLSIPVMVLVILCSFAVELFDDGGFCLKTNVSKKKKCVYKSCNPCNYSHKSIRKKEEHGFNSSDGFGNFPDY